MKRAKESGIEGSRNKPPVTNSELGLKKMGREWEWCWGLEIWVSSSAIFCEWNVVYCLRGVAYGSEIASTWVLTGGLLEMRIE